MILFHHPFGFTSFCSVSVAPSLSGVPCLVIDRQVPINWSSCRVYPFWFLIICSLSVRFTLFGFRLVASNRYPTTGMQSNYLHQRVWRGSTPEQDPSNSPTQLLGCIARHEWTVVNNPQRSLFYLQGRISTFSRKLRKSFKIIFKSRLKVRKSFKIIIV